MCMPRNMLRIMSNCMFILIDRSRSVRAVSAAADKPMKCLWPKCWETRKVFVS